MQKLKKVNSFGYNPHLELAHKSPKDWTFGALSIPCITDIPEEERIKYLPNGELQNIGDEKMDCASRAPINLLEIKFTWLYQNKKLTPSNTKFLEANGYVVNGRVLFSDRFVAINSNTTAFGNSMIAPIKAIHEKGLIPKTIFPQVEHFDEYYDKSNITGEMIDLGKEFITRFPIFYEQVFSQHFVELYKDDMIIEAGYAWSNPVNGEYPRTDAEPNHVFLGLKRPSHTVFDNYIDYTDNDFIKKLSSDYNLVEYGYRLFIQEWKGDLGSLEEFTDMGSTLIHWLKNIWGYIIKLLKKLV